MRARGRHVEGQRDANQPDRIADYEALGCSVVDLGGVGGGLADLLVGCVGITDLSEVKMPGEDLRPSQVAFGNRWRGSRPWQVASLDDVLAHVADMRRRGRLK